MINLSVNDCTFLDPGARRESDPDSAAMKMPPWAWILVGSGGAGIGVSLRTCHEPPRCGLECLLACWAPARVARSPVPGPQRLIRRVFRLFPVQGGSQLSGVTHFRTGE
jgi:hypothetical protein